MYEGNKKGSTLIKTEKVVTKSLLVRQTILILE